jgi:flagellar basal-body rod modification protein FlgD
VPSTNPVTDFLGYTPTQKTDTPSNAMGQDTFMKLLVTQMRMQNPMEPSDDKEMIAQMTQFSMLEQLTQLATASTASATAGHVSQAVGLIGHDVTYTGADGAAATGTVQEVAFKNGQPVLTVGGVQDIAPAQITQVR